MRWKWIVGVGIFLIIASMVMLYIILNTYDYNQLKPRIARMVKDATGRELHLGGEINLAIGFSPSLVITDVAIANASWGSQPQMIEIEKLQAQVRLLPLLFKDVKVEKIGLSGVKVLIETGPDAQGNWDIFAGNGPAERTSTFKPTAIDVDQVSIENLQFTFLSQKTGTQTQFASLHSLIANLDGSIGVVMGEGYLTKYLDMLSIGLSQKVFQFWKASKAVDQIKCAVVQFDIKAGVAVSQAFIFDTQAGVLAGEGKINLGTEKINFLLVPKPAHPELSVLTNLRVSGSVKEPHVGVDKASVLTQGAKALSFLAIGPLGLLAPFVHLGANKAHPCDFKSIEQLGLDIPAKK